MSRLAVNEIVNGPRSITPATALRLAKALGTTAEFWLNGQLAVDLYEAEHDEKQRPACRFVVAEPVRLEDIGYLTRG
jgi:plasmid maintenance system antidote protein VapI